ncbi:hypothetical protein LY474_35655 [Myxococcus stipitatus]|uniref:hypothetical protein n=1 Tax=Myxococcus stipitatus TaxID=83455 RepID=UPI001F205639|nr:hypothetical protein [Myxococcus stipitatus]MCE9673156.1 hypothetical protein [Myxococcus stipitatus]
MGRIVQGARRLVALARKERDVHGRLHRDALAALHRMEARSPELRRTRARAYACIVFPSLGQGSAILGGAWGLGEVFVRGHLVGYAALVRATLGVQLGGQTSSEVILLEDREAFEGFKASPTGLALEAVVTLVKAGVAWALGPRGRTSVFVATRGGLWAGASLGVQRVFFVPAVLTRGRGLRGGAASLGSTREQSLAPKENGAREREMARSQVGSKVRKALTGPSHWGRGKPESRTRRLAEHAKAAVHEVGERGRHTVEQLKEHVPSGEQLRARAGQAREWASERVGAHPVAVGLTTLAAGVAGAALLPISHRERRALNAASRRVKSLSHSLGERRPVAKVSGSVQDAMARVRGRKEAPERASGEQAPPRRQGSKAVDRPGVAAKTARSAAKKPRSAAKKTSRVAKKAPPAAKTSRAAKKPRAAAKTSRPTEKRARAGGRSASPAAKKGAGRSRSSSGD